VTVIKQIDVGDLQALRQAGAPLYLVDVRQPWEHETAALPGSVLVPLDELFERAAEIAPPAGATVVVYCHHGVRSLSGAAILAELGHREVVSLRGGIDAWSRLIDREIPRY
jgi:rhodanese-related sulfurtransferase